MEHLIDFDIYCPKCDHERKNEGEHPCCDCLDTPAREDSNKPIYFEERQKG